MKMRHLAVAALLASVSSVPASAAVFVTYAPASGVTPGFTILEDHEGFAPGDSIGTNALIFGDSEAGVAARPNFGSTGNFAAALAGGSATANLTVFNGVGYASVGFVLGSLDTYNTLTLGLADGTSIQYVGGQIINDLTFPSGDQIAGETNGFVSYRSDGALITSITFESSQNAFEWDNIASGAIPEPTTWAMMIGGFGLVGGALRRRKANVSFA